jgi:hypothetical protein
MGFLDDLVKTALPVAAGAFLGPAAGTGLFGGLNPALSGALVSGGLGLLTGQKPKDALKSALLGGLGGYGRQAFTAMNAPVAPGMTPVSSGLTPMANIGGQTMSPKAAAQAARSAAAGAGGGSTAGIPAKTFSAELLQGIGMGGDPGQENLLYKLLNTQVGEGILAGLASTAIDKYFGDDEEEDNRGSFERRPYGAGGPGGQLGGINYADGGEAYFPRRNGGIDPNEGSGRADDVPAMLMAGEFVMTRDAVKGAGGGDLRQGINKMYNLMDQFEGMA